MSKQLDLQATLASLDEIRGIMSAMKNLAFMEIRKLSGFLSAQQLAVKSIERAAADFMHFHGVERKRKLVETALLIGSERGLCGDFNERLVETSDHEIPVIAIGSKLDSRLEKRLALIEGPNVAEEVESVLTKIVDRLAMLQGALPEKEALGITAYYHGDEAVTKRRLLPLPEKTAEAAYPYEPLLYLEPFEFYEKLSGHYLYAALHEALCSSLMAENRYRLDHMENAIRQMDKRIERLKQHYNLLRQEEITEEIEVIMLSVDALSR